MRSWLKNTILLIVIVALVVPATLFTRPKKAEAIISCFLGNIIGGVAGAVGSAVGSVLAVPVHDTVHTQISTQNYGENKAQTTKECLLDFLVNVLANTMIRQFTNSVVEWINNGFHGSPSFVTDPEGFFMEIGDIAIGQSIESLGPIGELLCSGFDLDLRLALGLQYSTSRKEYVGCRLSDVQKNMMNSFTKGNFGGKAGWSNWLSITSKPQNNPYGTFFRLNAEIDGKIVRFQNSKIQELNQGKGFLSYKKCPSPEGSEEAFYEDLEGKCKTVTPGSVIESQLNSHLGSETRKLEMADEINEIIGALVNQALVQVMKATGLSGGSSRSYGGGKSYTYSAPSNTQAAYEREIAIQTTRSLPAGVTITCSAYAENVYEIRPSATAGAEAEVWFSKPVYNPTTGELSGYSRSTVAQKTSGNWTETDLRAVDAYCRNERESSTAGAFIPKSPVIETAPQEIPLSNIAFRKPATQAGLYWYDPPGDDAGFFVASDSADKAVDGVTSAGQFGVSAAVTNQYTVNPWWQVDLETDHYIDTVIVYKSSHQQHSYESTLNPLRVQVLAADKSTVWDSGAVSLNSYSPIPYKVKVGRNGRYVLVTRTAGQSLLVLGEVEVMGRPVNLGATPGNTPASLSADLSPSTQSIIMVTGQEINAGGTSVGEIRLDGNGVGTKSIIATVGFERMSSGFAAKEQFVNVFTTAKLEITNISTGEKVVHDLMNLQTGANPLNFEEVRITSISFDSNSTYSIKYILAAKSAQSLNRTYNLNLKLEEGRTVLDTQKTEISIR